MTRRKRILLIDDSLEIQTALGSFLTGLGYEFIGATDGAKGLETVGTFSPDLILLDLTMPGLSGLEVQAELNRRGVKTPVVIVTGHNSMQNAILTIRAGAYDYVTKPFDLERIRLLLRHYFDDHDVSAPSPASPRTPSTAGKFELLGSSPAAIEIYKTIGVIANTDSSVNVLICGDTGTGKELIARQIHAWGARARSPFIAVNVTALPDNLVESELFGHEKGAFTGAAQRVEGKLEQARDGTLLLDEIGDLSLHLQHKLLRVLQEREFYRLGGSEVVPLRARVVAATNKELKKLVEAGRFRDGLYYRLNAIQIMVPPLRARVEDIPLLAEHFLEKHSLAMGRTSVRFDDAAIRLLCQYPWPGNVRELENAVLKVLAASRTNLITYAHFQLDEHQANAPLSDNITGKSLTEARRLALDALDKAYIIEAIKQNNGNIPNAAAQAGINRVSFYRLMRKYDISSAESD